MANSLITRGIDKETAVKNVLKITRSLSQDDLTEIAEYNGPEDFEQLTEALTKLIEDERRASIINDEVARPMVIDDSVVSTKQMDAVSYKKPVDSDMMAATRSMNAVHTADFNRAELNAAADTKQMDAIRIGDLKKRPAKTMDDTKTMGAVHTGSFKAAPVEPMAETRKADAVPVATRRPEPSEVRTRTNIPAQESSHTHYTEYHKTELTSRGAKFFWTIFILTLPLTLLFTIAYFGIFALCVVSVAALIVGCFVIMGCVVIAGSLIGLVGLIFGVIQMFGTVGIGLYEIGVAIVVSGLTVIVSVLVYLLATRVLPYLLKQLVAFTKHTLSQLPGLIDRAREECNRL